MIRLTDEEIFELLPGYYASMKWCWLANPANDPSANMYPSPQYHTIAKAQLKKVVEFQGGICTEHDKNGIMRLYCRACWQALLEGVKE